MRELQDRYFERTRVIVDRYGGVVEKFIGDAVMAMWGAPVAHEDDAERAVRPASTSSTWSRHSAGSRASISQVRVGVLTGEAAVTVGAEGQGMVTGDLVNTAVATPVGRATRARAGRRGDADRRRSRRSSSSAAGDQALKGKTAPVPAWLAIRVVGERGGARRPDALEPPFVGRTDELRFLKEQFHAVGRERRARLVSLVGQAGIGKSRLAWELEKYLDGVVEQVWWHRGRSPSYGEGVTFWALGEMIRRRAGLAEGDDEETTRARSRRCSQRARRRRDRARLDRATDPRPARRSARRPPAAGRSCSPRGGPSSSDSPRRARSPSSSRTSNGPTTACSTSSSTCSTGAARARSSCSPSPARSSSSAGPAGARTAAARSRCGSSR